MTAVAIVVTVGLAAPADAAKPAALQFSKSIERYPGWQSEAGCSNTPKVGTRGLGNLMNKTWPGHTIYYVRACGSPGESSHEVGRGIDWMVRNSSQRQDAKEFISWLLATDKNGNKHAMARRLGVMYMIYDRKIWKAYDGSPGWSSYKGANPHVDHIHISLTRDGAAKRTSYWKGKAPAKEPVKAPATLRICNSGNSHTRDGRVNGVNNNEIFSVDLKTKVKSKPLGPGKCATVKNSKDLRIDLARAGSWKVRSFNGEYGGCNTGNQSNPGNWSGYSYQLFRKSNCTN